MRMIGSTLTQHDLEFAAADRGSRDGKVEARAFAERLQELTAHAEAASRHRRAVRAQSEQRLRECREARVAAERQIDAPLTPIGQLLGAARRGRWGW